MLPGFRFLFAAIVLSMSILVFGLGAAALLRAAHEEFASTPSWHAAPEAIFAQPNEAAAPVLAMLHVDPPVVEQKAPDETQQVAAPVAQPAILPTPVEAEVKTALIESEKTTALPRDGSPPETANPEAAKPELVNSESVKAEPVKPEAVKSEIPVTESPTQEAAPAQAVAAVVETKIATLEAPSEESTPPAHEAVPAAPEQTSVSEQASPIVSADSRSAETDLASTKIATLGGPPVTIDAPPMAKSDIAKHDKSATKKHAEERRTKRHRRTTSRARATQQALQQASDPFGQPIATAGRR
jgi:hypothetical protein